MGLANSLSICAFTESNSGDLINLTNLAPEPFSYGCRIKIDNKTCNQILFAQCSKYFHLQMVKALLNWDASATALL